MSETIHAVKTVAGLAKQPFDSRALWTAIQSGALPVEFGEISPSVASERNADGRNALMWACHLGNVEWVHALAKISSLAETDSSGRSALMWAADSGIGMSVEPIIGEYESLFNADNAGETATMIAARRGHSHNVLDLIRHHRGGDYPRATAQMFEVAFDADPFFISDASGANRLHLDAIRRRIEALPSGAILGRGRTPLHLAARHGLLGTVDRMLGEGADPGALDDELRTPLIESVIRRSEHSIGTDGLAVAERLISVSDPMWGSRDGKTALMHAAEAGAVDMVQLLLPVSAPNTRTFYKGWNAYAFAMNSRSEQRGACMALLAPVTQGPRRANRADVQGNIFRAAAASGDINKILSMLAGESKRIAVGRAGQRLGERVDGYGRDALMIAAAYGQTACIDTLMGCCGPHAEDNWHDTALIIAAKAGRAECVRHLLSGSHPDARNKDGNTALMLAAAGGHMDALRLLIPCCRTDLTNNEGETASMLAAKRGAHEAVELLASRVGQI